MLAIVPYFSDLGSFGAVLAGAFVLSGLAIQLRFWHFRRRLAAAMKPFALVLFARPSRGRMTVEVDGLAGEMSWAKTAYGIGVPRTGWVRLQLPWTPAEPVIVSIERHQVSSAAVIPLGDPAFDGRFEARGHTPAYVRALLTEEARRRLEAIAGLEVGQPHNEPPLMDAGPAGFTLRFHRNLATEPARMAAFLDHGLAVFRALRAAAPAAAELVRADAGRCPVCGDPLRDPVRRCSECATPHHGECWSYFGGCAIFACRSRGSRAGAPTPAAKGK